MLIKCLFFIKQFWTYYILSSSSKVRHFISKIWCFWYKDLFILIFSYKYYKHLDCQNYENYENLYIFGINCANIVGFQNLKSWCYYYNIWSIKMLTCVCRQSNIITAYFKTGNICFTTNIHFFFFSDLLRLELLWLPKFVVAARVNISFYNIVVALVVVRCVP